MMQAPAIDVAPGIAWGLGWGLESEPTGQAMWHHGDNSLSGFTAFAWVSAGGDSAVVYFANSTTGLGIAGEVLRSTVGGVHPSIDWIKYEPYNSPVRIARLAIYRRLIDFGPDSGRAEYQRQKGQFPELPEAVLNTLGYRMLQLQRAGDAVAMFLQNVSEFPTSSNAYDSLGDGYVAVSDTARAIGAYRKSLELDSSNSHAVEMVRRLGGLATWRVENSRTP